MRFRRHGGYEAPAQALAKEGYSERGAVVLEEETQLPGESRGCALVFALGQKGFCEVIPAGTAAQAKPNLAGAAEPETDDACL